MTVNQSDQLRQSHIGSNQEHQEAPATGMEIEQEELLSPEAESPSSDETPTSGAITSQDPVNDPDH